MDRQSQIQRRMEVVAERVNFVDGTGTIRAPISREPPIDRPAQDFEAEPPTQVLEADLLAPMTRQQFAITASAYL